MDTKSVLPDSSVTKNVTITLDDRLARWVRVRAAQQDLSVSRFVAEMSEERRGQEEAYDRSRQRWLRRQPVPLKAQGDDYPSREDLHERPDPR